jgi:hypothetical protein
LASATYKDVSDIFHSNVGFFSGIWKILVVFKNRFLELLKLLWDFDIAHKSRLVLLFLGVWLFVRKARSDYGSIHAIITKLTSVFSPDAAQALDLANECMTVINTSATVEVLEKAPRFA